MAASSPSRSSQRVELLFVDVWGPAPIISTTRFSLYLAIVDDFTKYLWLFPLQSKSDVSNFFIAFLWYLVIFMVISNFCIM